ncbi:MAG TPA: hypothetical protein ENL09_04660 [Bacteroidetes bacterium]|nr:hypothetical protein [Bacteroidota bacterium]
MANEILLKSRTTITAQGDGTALTADVDPNGAYTGDTPVVLDNTYDGGTENCFGADYLNLELNVTTAPGTEANAEIWYSISEDGTNYTKWKYSHTVGDAIAISADRYAAGIFFLSANYTKLVVVAKDYGFNAQLLATPKLHEAQ